METLEQRKRRLFGKNNLQTYLKELNALTKIEITKYMLLSLVESDKIGSVDKEYFYKSNILFKEKNKLLLFINYLIKVKDGECYLNTSYSKDCGVLKLSSLKDFNINFKFFNEHSGILSIILKDLSNELLLDYFEEDNEYYLEIEVYGKDWANICLKNSV